MSQQGAALQTYNNELIKCINDLCAKRDDIQKQILLEEVEKQKLQNDIGIFTERLANLNESLSKNLEAKKEFDQTIAETENAYMKILANSQTLLSVFKAGETQFTRKVKHSDQFHNTILMLSACFQVVLSFIMKLSCVGQQFISKIGVSPLFMQ